MQKLIDDDLEYISQLNDVNYVSTISQYSFPQIIKKQSYKYKPRFVKPIQMSAPDIPDEVYQFTEFFKSTSLQSSFNRKFYSIQNFESRLTQKEYKHVHFDLEEDSLKLSDVMVSKSCQLKLI